MDADGRHGRTLRPLILDAGFLISVDRGEEAARHFLTAAGRARTALHTTHPVLAQVWRDGATQARLAQFLKSVTVHALEDGRSVGQLLALTGTADVVDAHLVVLALRLDAAIVTSDTDDLTTLADALGATKPAIEAWP